MSGSIKIPSEHYLGDGLYATIDQGQITLRAPRPEGDHVVYLEPATLIKLVDLSMRARWLSADDLPAPPAA